MNPGPVEEAGQTARHVVTGLASTPALLAIIVIQFLTLASIGYVTVMRQNDVSEQFKMLFDRCLPAKGGP